jgi:hypothetical protein
LREERKALLSSVVASNILSLREVRDESKNAKARVNAARALSLMEAETDEPGYAKRHAPQAPGITIVIESGRSARVLNPPPAIEHERTRTPGHLSSDYSPNSRIPDVPITTAQVPRSQLSKSDIAAPFRDMADAMSAPLCPAKRINGTLQSLHGGEPEGYRCGIEAAKCLGQRRETLPITVGLSRRPSKSRLDEHAKRNRFVADRQHGDHHASRCVDHRHGVVR